MNDIFQAVAQNDVETVKYLVNHGADSNVTDLFGRSPLSDAKTHEFDSIINLLKDGIIPEDGEEEIKSLTTVQFECG